MVRSAAVDVQRVDVAQLVRVDEYADFFLHLAHGGVDQRFAGVEFARWQVPESVEVRVAITASVSRTLA